MAADRTPFEAFKDLISETDRVIGTTPALPQDRSATCRENLRAALALTDDLLARATTTDLFLVVDGVRTEEDAATWSINSALQRNKVYRNDEDCEGRAEFRKEWATLIRGESQPYCQPAQPISDSQHCAAIGRIAEALSLAFGPYLNNGRLRYGTSQRAFNLYLKYLWRMGKAAMPPHCPVDRVVLDEAGIDGCWTRCDSEQEYMQWINKIREKTSLARWEYDVWLRRRLNTLGV